MEKIYLKIKRQENPEADSYWEDFEIPKKPNMTVISLLMEIQKNPINKKGEATIPVVWESNCLEEVCGSCTFLINGRPRPACSAMVHELSQTITLEPLSRFPVLRDLIVDRRRMFEDFKKIKGWIPIDGTYSLDLSPVMAREKLELASSLAECINCGACLEVCPQYHDKSPFMGAAAINRVRLLNMHLTANGSAEERLERLMGEGGIDDCGNAQNCVKACPKEIPLTESIAKMGREVTKYAFGRLLGR